MIADVPTLHLEKIIWTIYWWGMTAGKVEILLIICRFEMGRVEIELVNITEVAWEDGRRSS